MLCLTYVVRTLNHITIEFIFIVRNGSNQESKETLLNVPEKAGGNVTVETESPKTESQEKKIWTRGEFTHQNCGIGGSDDNEDYRYKYEFLNVFFNDFNYISS